MQTTDLDGLLQRILDARTKYEEAKEISNGLYHEKVALEMEFLDALKTVGKTSWKIDGIGTASLVESLDVQVAKTVEDKRALFQYVVDKYGEDVAFDKFSMHSKTLGSFYKEELASADDPSLFSLPGIAEPISKLEFRFRKS